MHKTPIHSVATNFHCINKLLRDKFSIHTIMTTQTTTKTVSQVNATNENIISDISMPTIHNLITDYDLDWEYIEVYMDTKKEGKPVKRPLGIDKNCKSKTELHNVVNWRKAEIYEKLGFDCEFNLFVRLKILRDPMVVIDIDEEDVTIEDVYKKFPALKDSYYLKGNTKGFHIYVHCEDMENIQTEIDVLKYFKGDLITDNVWERANKELYGDDLVELSPESIKEISPTFAWKPSKPKSSKSTSETNKIKPELLTAEYEGNLDELKELVDIIPTHYSNDAKDWMKALCAFRKYNLKDLARSFSQKSKKYNEAEFNEVYENNGYTDIGIGTIFEWAKSSKTKYDKIRAKYKKKEIIKTRNLVSFKEKMEEFEQTHFKVIDKNVFCKYENNILQTFTPNKFAQMYAHLTYVDANENIRKFIDDYMNGNENMRTYVDMDVYPKVEECPAHHFNLWMPFAVEQIEEYEKDEEALDVILKHIMILSNNETEVYEYILDWLAHMFQMPWQKPEKFILFLSKEGTGKGLFFELLRNMIGNSRVFETSDPARDVWGNFNGGLMNSFLINIEELDFAQTKGADGKIKNLITQPYIAVRKLHQELCEIRSYHRMIASTNNLDCPKKISESNRRDFLVRCSDELIGNKAYFKKFKSIISSKNAQKTFFDFLKERENIDLFMSKPMPITAYQQALAESFEDPVTRFLKNFVDVRRGQGGMDVSIVMAKDLFDNFLSFLDDENCKYECSNARFAMKIKNLELQGITKFRKKNGNAYRLDIEKLVEELNINNGDFMLLSDSESDYPTQELITMSDIENSDSDSE